MILTSAEFVLFCLSSIQNMGVLNRGALRLFLKGQEPNIRNGGGGGK